MIGSEGRTVAILLACKTVRSSTRLTGFVAGGERVGRVHDGLVCLLIDCWSFFENIAGAGEGGCCRCWILGGGGKGFFVFHPRSDSTAKDVRKLLKGMLVVIG